MSTSAPTFPETPALAFIIGVPLMFVIYVTGDYLSRLSTRVTFVVYLVFLLSCPLWFIQPLDTAFEYVKMFSIFIPVQIFNAVRLEAMLYNNEDFRGQCSFHLLHVRIFTPIRKRLPLIVIWVLLFVVLQVNIAEAVLSDTLRGNYYNAVAGAILIITLPFPAVQRNKEIPKYRRFMGIDTNKQGDGYHDLLFDIPIAWSILFTTWDMAFALDERKEHAASVAAVLAAPLARALWNNRYDLWAQSRVYTLAIRYIILAYYDVYEEVVNSSSWSNPSLVLYWGIINLVLCGIYGFWWLAIVFGYTSREPYFFPPPPDFPVTNVDQMRREAEQKKLQQIKDMDNAI